MSPKESVLNEQERTILTHAAFAAKANEVELKNLKQDQEALWCAIVVLLRCVPTDRLEEVQGEFLAIFRGQISPETRESLSKVFEKIREALDGDVISQAEKH